MCIRDRLWAARKVLLKAAGIGAIVGVIIALSIPKQYTVEVTLSPESGKSELTRTGNLTIHHDSSHILQVMNTGNIKHIITL